MNEPHQIVLVEDQDAVRRGLELLLSTRGYRITGTTGTADEGKDMILRRRPDVAIVDVGLPDGSGLEMAREVLAADPALGLLLYTGTGDANVIVKALASGVRGFAMKAGPPGELFAAIDAVASGGEYVDVRVADLLSSSAQPGVLSARECEVLTLIAGGKTSNAVAAELWLSPLTVETHVRNLMRKLHANSRVHALALALKHGEIRV
ncbi:MAG: response regulator transcription factor [Gaiellaceae bacterium]